MKNLPKIYDLTLEEIDEPLILGVIEKVVQKRTFVITPLNILGVTGFPIREQNEVLSNKNKIRKIKGILLDLSKKGILKQRQSKQDHLGIKEVAYNLIND